MHEHFEISSVGHIAQQLQAPVSQILNAADRLGIKPSFVNNVQYFCVEDVALIREGILAEMRLHELPIDNQCQNIS